MELDEIMKLPALLQIQEIRAKIVELKDEVRKSERQIPEIIRTLPAQLGCKDYSFGDINLDRIKENLLAQLAMLGPDPEKEKGIRKGLAMIEKTLSTVQTDNQDKRNAVIRYLYWHDLEIKVSWLGQAFNLGTRDVVQIAGSFQLPTICERCENFLTITRRSDLSSADYLRFCPSCEEGEREQKNLEWERRTKQHQSRLFELKTMPYADYLQTPEWTAIRNGKLRSAHYKCQVCNTGNPPLNVHHRHYRNRGNENPQDLIVLCQPCHELFHENGRLPNKT